MDDQRGKEGWKNSHADHWRKACLDWANTHIPQKRELDEFVTERLQEVLARHPDLGNAEQNTDNEQNLLRRFKARCQLWMNEHAAQQWQRWRKMFNRLVREQRPGDPNHDELAEDCLQEVYARLSKKQQEQLICDVTDYYACSVGRNYLTDLTRKELGNAQALKKWCDQLGESSANLLFRMMCWEGMDKHEILENLADREAKGDFSYAVDPGEYDYVLQQMIAERDCERLRQPMLSLDAPSSATDGSGAGGPSLADGFEAPSLTPEQVEQIYQIQSLVALWTELDSESGEASSATALGRIGRSRLNLRDSWKRANLLTEEEKRALRTYVKYWQESEQFRADLDGFSPTNSRRRRLSAIKKICRWLDSQGIKLSDLLLDRDSDHN